VVVDGYNTDELYHFNFGWGGSQNGWYTMPPTSIYYNLTIIEGVVLNINSTNPPVGLKPESEAGQRPDFKYLAKQQELEIELPAGMNASELSIADLSGKIRFTKSLAGAGSVVKISLPENELQRQICLVRLSTTDGKVFSYKFLR
jgi:hypothetical protein